MTKKTLYLIDGSSFLYRAFYALKPMTSSSGAQVGAVYGFCRMIKKIIDTFNPEYLSVVWDSKGATMRHELYPDYKATRQAAPMHLFDQKFIIQHFIDQIHLNQVEKSGYEADDLLYSIARDFSKENYNVIVITTDKDLGQIVNEDIKLYDAFKHIFLDKQTLETNYGFPIEKLPFFFALCGDSSDNIPGVRGIGPKGATDLVKQFDSLQDMYDNIEKIPKERTRELLQASEIEAFLSEKLFLLEYTDLKLTPQNFAFSADNWKHARGFFETYDFKSLLKEFPEERTLQKHYKPVAHYILVQDQKALENVIQEIKNHKAVALDTETDGTDVMRCKLLGISAATQPGTAYYILAAPELVALLKPVLEDASIKKYFHHAKFDLHVLAHAGIDVQGLAFDTFIAASLLRQDSERIGLKALSETYFDEPMLSFEDVVKKNGYKDFSQVPLELATEYAAADAHQTLKLVTVFRAKLEQENLLQLYTTLEQPLIPILLAMEERGIICDSSVLEALNKQVIKELESITAQIIDLAGPQYFAINLNSPAQLKALLFEHLKLPTIKKTTSKATYSTDQEVLEELARIHSVPALIIKHREHSKLKNTYLEGLREWIDKKTERIHTSFNQAQVATGRLSSSDPNLQNVPVSVRAAFKAEVGQVFLAADYSQIELRVVAYLSQDPVLIKAFAHNIDIHQYTAARIFGIAEDSVTQEQRQVGKRINFSILYGLTPFGLSKDLNISYGDAKTYIDKYFAEYAGVASWMERVIEDTKRDGYVTTWRGRRRYIPGIYERNKSLYEAARRIAINTQAQGTAAELIKIAMIKLDAIFKQEKLQAQILLQIHDELVITAPEQEKERVKDIMQKTMETIVDWNVPLVVSLSEGHDWASVS